MKTIFCAVISALLIVSGPSATTLLAQPTATANNEQQAIELLINELEKLATAPMPAEGDKSRISGEISAAPKLIKQLRELLAKKNFTGARGRLMQFKSWAVRPATIEKMVELEESLRSAEAAIVDTTVADARKTLEKVDDTIALATKPTELDALLGELQGWKDSSDLNGPGEEDIRSAIYRALRGVTEWKQLLAAVESNDSDQIETVFRRISTNSVITPEIVRARQEAISSASLKEFMEGIAVAQKALDAAKTSDELLKVAETYQLATSTLRTLPWPDQTSRPRAKPDDEAGWIRRFAAGMNQMESGRYRAATDSFESVLNQQRNPMNREYTLLLKIEERRLQQLIDHAKGKIANERQVIDEPLLREWVGKLNGAGDTLAFLGVARDYVSVSRAMGSDSRNNSYNFDNATLVAELRALTSDLAWFDTAWGHLTNKRFGDFWNMGDRSRGAVTESYRWRDRMIAAREMLLGQALIDSNLTPEAVLKDKSKPIQDAILAYVDQSVREKNWIAVRDGLDGYRLAFYGTNPLPQWLSADLAAADAYIRGQRFESAGVLVDAAMNYLRALDAASQRIPVEAITPRLDAIRAADPNAIESARSQLASQPPTSFVPPSPQTTPQQTPQPRPQSMPPSNQYNPTTQPR